MKRGIMKLSKPESIFKRIDNRFDKLPEATKAALAIFAIVVGSVINVLIAKEYFPSKPAHQFNFTVKSEEEIKTDKIASIKETMDETYIKRMPNDIGSELAIGYKEMAFRTLSFSKNTYSKELCESYNTVAFCAELKAEFAASINATADRTILEANVDREYELKKLEN
jgi:hypothetical protein